MSFKLFSVTALVALAASSFPFLKVEIFYIPLTNGAAFSTYKASQFRRKSLFLSLLSCTTQSAQTTRTGSPFNVAISVTLKRNSMSSIENQLKKKETHSSLVAEGGSSGGPLTDFLIVVASSESNNVFSVNSES